MAIDIKGLAADRAKSTNVKFTTVGDFGEGQIRATEMVDDPNDGTAQILVITLVDEAGTERKLWARSAQMLEAISDAVDRASADGLDIGDWIKVTYISDQTLRSGRVMKVYAAEVVAGFSNGEAF